MADRYDHSSHRTSIRDRKEALNLGVDLGAEESEQVRRRLNDIADGVSNINAELADFRDRLPLETSRPSVEPPRTRLGRALADGLRDAGVPRSDANDAASKAADHIGAFVDDNDSNMTDRDLAKVVRTIDGSDEGSSEDYADEVYDRVRAAVLDPGRGLPHHMQNLERAREVLAAAGCDSDERSTRSSRCKQEPELKAPTPSCNSSEVLRDVSHLTTLLLGSSPAFAEAMRFQSDAVAYSLAALNKVGDMQRQDALGLAITARAAASKFENS